MAAAVVGGAAYHIGKKGQQSRDQQETIDAQQQELDQQQYAQQAPPPQAAPAQAAPSEEDSVAKLQQLKGLLDSGVLTQAEFDFQKQKILQTM